MASNSELVALADGEVVGEAAICKFVNKSSQVLSGAIKT
jgi:hypothetical protein